VAGGTKPQVIAQKAKTADIEEFTTNEEYLTAWLDLAQILLEDGDDVSFRSQNQKRKPRTKQLERPATELPEVQSILRKLLHNTTIYPLGQIIIKHEFDDNERIIIALAFSMGIRSKQLQIALAVNLIAGDNLFLRLRYESYFAPNAPLISSGLVTITPSSTEESTFTMPRSIVHKVMGVENEGTTSALQHSPFFEHRPPTINLDRVVLPKHIRTTLEIAIASTRNDLAERMRAWGIKQITASRSSRSLVLLLSGPPGTGKTYCAEAVAGTLGRDLFIGGAEKILSKWHGESEHNLQEMFSSYAQLARDCETPPILLLNEADQLLMTRSSYADQSTDHTEHRLQNILLENLENFDGILIATTNLVSSLDEAFSRRFDYKVIFPMPDADARLAIWKAHIPTSVPLSGDIDLQSIADRFSMSGGSIAVACANALRSAAVRGDELRQEDIIRACVTEEQGGFEHSVSNQKHRSIGFVLQNTVDD
jgi:AAA+ superfamily predicted ATPase